MAKLSHISEAMKQWCALMESELLGWPQVEAKPMFGMLAFYRKGRIFACIPKDRNPGNVDSVLVKLRGAPEKLAAEALRHPRSLTSAMPQAGWICMAMDSIDDVREMLNWFSRAYELTGKSPARVRAKSRRSGGAGL